MVSDANDVVIIDYCRSGVGYKDGSLSYIRSDSMLVPLIEALRDRNPKFKDNLENLAKDFKVDSIIGCNNQIGTSALTTGRTAALGAHYPIEVPGMSINRQCASGMQSIFLGIGEIKLGTFDFVICGGFEQQSKMPIGQDMVWVDVYGNVRREAPHPKIAKNPYITDPFDRSKQGVMAGQLPGAEMIGELYKSDRETLDKFSIWSHEKAVKNADLRHKEIHPIEVPYVGELLGEPNQSVESKTCVRASNKKGKIAFLLADNDFKKYDEIKEKMGLEGSLTDNLKHFTYKVDESARSKNSLEFYAKMKGAVKRKGILTASNSCPENDGASAMLLASREAAEQLGLKPRAHIKYGTVVGCDPVLMLTGPQVATKTLFKRHGIGFDDLAMIEVNEAFSTVLDAFCKDTGFDLFDERLNRWGGSIAIGHPTASTGCRLIGSLVHQMEEANSKPGTLALATLCVGLGMGIAGVVEKE